jgi:APA family basic amino acid/polyamine antiporter
LLKVLGLGFGVSVIIGNTIGGGIFSTPGLIAEKLRTPGLFLGVWVVVGAYAMLGAVSMAELGTRLPRSGGQYNFSRVALGEYAGFVVGWSDWLSTCGTAAAVSLLLAEFAALLVPSWAGHEVAIALVVTLFFGALQWHGVVWGEWTQNITSLMKALAFAVLVAACFYFGGGNQPAAVPAAVPTGWPLRGPIILAVQLVIYTYDGWTGAIYFSEEVRDPVRNIPRSLFGGVLAVIVIYLAINAALIYVMPMATIAGQDYAAGEAAKIVFGGVGDTVFRVITVVALLSAINSNHLMSSRVLYAMSRDGLVSRSFTRVNKGGTPTLALLLSVIVAVLFIVRAGAFKTAAAALAFFFIANYVLSFISLIVLRRRPAESPAPFYRAWGFPFTTGLSLLGSVIFLIGAVVSDTRNSVYALILLAASFPLFLLQKWLSRSAKVS